MASAEEMAAYVKAVRAPTDEATTKLIGMVGVGMVADMAGVSEQRVARQWGTGEHEPRGAQELRLRVAYQLAELVHMPDRPWVVRVWFISPVPSVEGSPYSLYGTFPKITRNRQALSRH